MSGRRGFEWIAHRRGALAAAILALVAVTFVVLVMRRPEPPRVIVQQATLTATEAAVPRVVASPQVPSVLIVHLAGEVIAPGVYRLPVGARVNDALKAAGGPTDSGDIHRLNLAARLADGQQIQVPRRVDPNAVSVAPVAGPTTGLVNLNLASVAELDRLPGVGPVTAQRIVAYREQHGPFTRLEQLREAKLVNAATFAKIKEQIEL